LSSVIQSIFNKEPGRKLWLTKKNARIRRAPARRSQVANIAAHHVRELATQSSSIVIAATKHAREISELDFGVRRL
jgi:hypothetical protein